jgi:hypothetical protein
MDIIGFDAQINAPRMIKRIVQKINKPVAARPVVKTAAMRPVAKTTAMRPVAKTAAMRPVAKAAAMRPVAKTAVMRPVVKPVSVIRPSPNRSITKFAPAQIPFTAKTKSNVLATSTTSQNAPLAVVKPTGQAIPVSTLTQTTNPNTVMNVSAVQRTFMPVDLPYQTPTPKSKIVRLTNTPYAYAVNIDMIEPSVDSGAGNYYGK